MACCKQVSLAISHAPLQNEMNDTLIVKTANAVWLTSVIGIPLIVLCSGMCNTAKCTLKLLETSSQVKHTYFR